MEASLLSKKFVGFAIVGTLSFLIDFIIYMTLSQDFGLSLVVAAFFSYVISTVLNYIASMHYVFTHRDEISRKIEFLLFVVLSLIGLIWNELIVWIGEELMGSGPFVACMVKLLATALVALWNYFSRRHWLDADYR